MATDPTRSTRWRRKASPFEFGVANMVERLSSLPPSTEVPYLTVTVDWRVQGDSPGRAAPVEVKRSQDRSGQEAGMRWRPAIEVLESRLKELVERHGPRGETYESLKQDQDRIFSWLENELDPLAHGAIIVASSANGVFEATGFALPLPTEVHTGPTPRLVELVRLYEDHPPYAVLHADQHEARLLYLSRGITRGSVTLTSNDYPRHQQTGGWSQARLQRRADERVEAFASDIAEATRESLDRTGVDALIIAGGEVMTTALEHEFHESVRERVVATIHLDQTATDDEILEATQDLADREERKREMALVSNVRDQVGSRARGVAGAVDTLRALQIGQVDTLAIADTFEGEGWADFGMHLFGVGAIPLEHPAGGDVAALVKVDLPNEMFRLALSSDVEIDVIHSDVPAQTDEPVRQSGEGMPITEAAASLNEIGGVGAVLRFALDETAPPQGV